MGKLKTKPAASNDKLLINKKKLIGVVWALITLMVLLMFRVGYWNIKKGDFLQEQAEKQWISDSVVSARRGSILDRNKNILAQSAASDTLVFIPKRIKDPNTVASLISPIIDMPISELLYKAATKKRINSSGKEVEIGEVWVKRQISSGQAEQIENLDLEGVKLISDIVRYYPSKELAAQVIGYTTLDGTGQTGIERRYNVALEGRQGRLVAETDKYRNDIPNGQEMLIDSIDGQNVILTIDEVMQNFLETACKEGYENLSADSVQGLILDIQTGEVLAMANIPSMDLNNPPRKDGATLTSLSVNRITAQNMVPGSIFTVFTGAAALEAGIDEQTYDCAGVKEWYGEEIMCTDTHGKQTFEEAIANGCRIAGSQMADKMGKQTFYNAISKFGFGEKTGIDFTTDSAGAVMGIKYASELDIAKMGAGSGLEVTQLQLANAFASLINNGELYVPRLVLGLSDTESQTSEQYEKIFKQNSVSIDTADRLNKIFRNNVATGEAKIAAIEDYTSGALYGTVDKYNSDGGLEMGKKVSFFFEYAPVSNPKYLVMVTINGIAADKAQFAGAPYARAVLKEILKYNYTKPDGGFEYVDEISETPTATETQTAFVPNVTDMGMVAALDLIEQSGFKYSKDGAGTVLSQEPAGGTEAPLNTVIKLTMDYKSAASTGNETPSDIDVPADNIETVKVPKFTGLSMQEAMKLAIDSGLKFYAQGDGIARKQYPVSGTEVQKGSGVTVTFKLEIADRKDA